MKKPARKQSVYGVTAPTPRMTKTAAFLVACALSVPVFIVLTLGQWVFG